MRIIIYRYWNNHYHSTIFHTKCFYKILVWKNRKYMKLQIKRDALSLFKNICKNLMCVFVKTKDISVKYAVRTDVMLYLAFFFLFCSRAQEYCTGASSVWSLFTPEYSYSQKNGKLRHNFTKTNPNKAHWQMNYQPIRCLVMANRLQ